MGLWMSFTALLNVLSAILLVAVFALIKKQAALKQDILRIQKEWIQWRATTTPQPEITIAEDSSAAEVFLQASEGPYISEHQVKEPSIAQSVRARSHFGDDWRPSAGGIREKAAKSLKSETLGDQPGDRFSKARELLRQGHGMKEVAVVTGLSYSELALISKTESTYPIH